MPRPCKLNSFHLSRVNCMFALFFMLPTRMSRTTSSIVSGRKSVFAMFLSSRQVDNHTAINACLELLEYLDSHMYGLLVGAPPQSQYVHDESRVICQNKFPSVHKEASYVGDQADEING